MSTKEIKKKISRVRATLVYVMGTRGPDPFLVDVLECLEHGDELQAQLDALTKDTIH